MDASPEALVRSVRTHLASFGADLLVVRGECEVGQRLLSSLPSGNLPLHVVRAGSGMNNINKDYLNSLGVVYSNTPDVNTASTADLTLSHLLDACRSLSRADQQVKQGSLDRDGLFGVTLSGKKLGIVGFGQIGQAVAARAKGFGMQVCALRPRSWPADKPAPEGVEFADSVDEVCEQADFLTLHVPLTPETRGMIGMAQLQKLGDPNRTWSNSRPRKPVVVNMARGAVLDYTAVAWALQNGALHVVATDVPDEGSDKLLQSMNNLEALGKLRFTPHIGGQAEEASEAMGVAVVKAAERLLKQFVDVSPKNRMLPSLAGNAALRRPWVVFQQHCPVVLHCRHDSAGEPEKPACGFSACRRYGLNCGGTNYTKLTTKDFLGS
ncbi:MAG: hypothetical protein HC848_08715 [Limnobacter sp.]|nr:hypothetical protein [Limnobacter sp.]